MFFFQGFHLYLARTGRKLALKVFWIGSQFFLNTLYFAILTAVIRSFILCSISSIRVPMSSILKQNSKIYRKNKSNSSVFFSKLDTKRKSKTTWYQSFQLPWNDLIRHQLEAFLDLLQHGLDKTCQFLKKLTITGAKVLIEV